MTAWASRTRGRARSAIDRRRRRGDWAWIAQSHRWWTGSRCAACARRWWILLGGFDDFVVEEVQSCAKHDPFDAVLVALAESLPYGLLFWCLARDANPGTASIGTWWVLLDLAEFDAFRGYIVASVGKVEHAPECSIGVWLRDLKERQIRGIGGRKRELVDRRDDSGVGDGPLEIPGGFAANYARGGRRSAGHGVT